MEPQIYTCRLCRGATLKGADVFESLVGQHLSSKRLKAVFQINLLENASLPTKACLTCIRAFALVERFRGKIIDSQKKLYEFAKSIANPLAKPATNPYLNSCRLCLFAVDTKTDIFRSLNGSKSYSVRLQEMCRIQLNCKDFLPAKACRKCLKAIDVLESFRENIIEIQKGFMQPEEDLDISPIDDTFWTNEIEEWLAAEYNVRNPLKRKTGDPMPGTSSNAGIKCKVERVSPSRRSLIRVIPQQPPQVIAKRPKPPAEENVTLQLNTFECFICQEKHATLNSFQAHMENAHKVKTPGIFCCGHKFAGAQAYEHMAQHKRSEDDQESTTRSLVSKNSPIKLEGHEGDVDEQEEAEEEEEEHHQQADEMMQKMNLLMCSVCKQKSGSYKSFKWHMLKAHHDKNPIIFCCRKKFKSDLIYSHMQYHLDVDAFKCRECSKSCLSARHLGRHAATHNDRKCTCDVCGKEFRDKPALAVHKKHHLPKELREYPCEKCEAAYATSGELRIHVRSRHTERQTKECGECHKHYLDLKGHMKRAHSSHETVKCEFCDYEGIPPRLKEHVAYRHSTKATTLRCETCERTFRSRKALREHVNAQHLGIRIQCEYCPISFSSSGNRHNHMTTKHPDEYRSEKEVNVKRLYHPRIKNLDGENQEIVLIDRRIW